MRTVLTRNDVAVDIADIIWGHTITFCPHCDNPIDSPDLELEDAILDYLEETFDIEWRDE